MTVLESPRQQVVTPSASKDGESSFSAAQSPHRWRFFRAGGFDQVRLDSAADLESLDQLDQKLWVALACPTSGLEIDSKTLQLIDADNDGRIRAPEVIAAVKWACSMLKNPAELCQGAQSLRLEEIDDTSDEGRRIRASARQILVNLGKESAESISVEDTTDTTRIFSQTRFNGDGVIPPDAADDPAVCALIAQIMGCVGAVKDRSGKNGIDRNMLERFFADAKSLDAWWTQAELEPGILPLGDRTPVAADALAAVRGKIEDYFARCRLAAFDGRAVAALNRREEDFLELAAKDLTVTDAEIAEFPLAHIEAGKPLPLCEQVNPAWACTLQAFRTQVVQPLLGDKTVLTEEEWQQISARFAPYAAWQASKTNTSVEKLGIAAVRAILSGQGRANIEELLKRDLALESEASAIAAVDKLVRYHRDLYRLLVNFVSFRDLYGRRDKAIFQAGRLYLDERSYDLCIRVEDMARHATMAHMSRSYLAYCDVVRKATGQKMTIVAAVTAGDSDNLMVGRNGIFYDRSGNDWDATIVKIVENPISIGQAFWSPYKRAIRWVEEQVAKRAASADAAAQQKLTSAAGTVGDAAETGKVNPPKSKIDIGVVAALGVAVGGITAALGMLLEAFFGLGILMPLGLVGLLLAISGPSMLIAWLKLRQRNLGPILDANGWAVNAKAKINIPFGRELTCLAKLPAGSSRDLFDPYAESRKGRRITTAVLIAVLFLMGLWYFGAIERVVPGLLPQSHWVKSRQTKAAVSPGVAAPATQAAPASS